MENFVLFAQPWWVNIFILVPVLTYWFYRRKGTALTRYQLIWLLVLGIAFGCVEAAVVIYLRAATGLLPGYGGSLSDLGQLSSSLYQQAAILAKLPMSLMVVEMVREAATIVLLVAVAFIATPKNRDRWLAFLLTFAAWDLFYYVFLRLLVGWPQSFTTPDVLFLLPVPWISQVWFPILISGASIVLIFLLAKKKATV